jgi:uncharacterized protein (DUF1697 family)
MPQLIAVLRGINVGRAKRIAIADLRALITSLGYTNVRTLLNSGNVIFEGPIIKDRRSSTSHSECYRR